MNEEIIKRTLVDIPRLINLSEYLKETAYLKKAMAEVGVYRGGTALLMSHLAENRELYLFDTFEGHPAPSDEDFHEEGDFGNYSLEGVQELFENNPNVYIYKGLFPGTGQVIRNKEFSLVHLDCDLYKSVKESLEFFYPRMAKGGIIVIDDYNCPDCPGAKLAVDMFMKDKPEDIVNECQTQVAIIKE